MSNSHDFHPRAFEIAGKENDSQYYETHPPVSLIDPGGYKAIEALYHTLIQKSDTIVDLMCGSDSHFPPTLECRNIIGIDVNPQALEQNGVLTQKIVQDINQTPTLPLPEDSVDYVCLCSVVEYLREPITTFKECYRILKPAGRIIISFSSHFLPSRTIALWQALDNADRQKFIRVLLTRTGFIHIDQGEVHPAANDPLWRDSIYSVVASKP